MTTLVESKRVFIDKAEKSKLAVSVLRAKMNHVRPSICPNYGSCAYFQNLVLEGGEGTLDNPKTYGAEICKSYPQRCSGFNV